MRRDVPAGVLDQVTLVVELAGPGRLGVPVRDRRAGLAEGLPARVERAGDQRVRVGVADAAGAVAAQLEARERADLDLGEAAQERVVVVVDTLGVVDLRVAEDAVDVLRQDRVVEAVEGVRRDVVDDLDRACDAALGDALAAPRAGRDREVELRREGVVVARDGQGVDALVVQSAGLRQLHLGQIVDRLRAVQDPARADEGAEARDAAGGPALLAQVGRPELLGREVARALGRAAQAIVVVLLHRDAAARDAAGEERQDQDAQGGEHEQRRNQRRTAAPVPLEFSSPRSQSVRFHPRTSSLSSLPLSKPACPRHPQGGH